MVLTTSELIASLQNEVRILLHLAGKVDGSSVDYRPTPKQRSTIELLRYLSMMGPAVVKLAQTGQFDPAAWGAEEQAVASLDLAGAKAAIARQSDLYESVLGGMSDQDLRQEVTIFGAPSSRGAFIVTYGLCGFAAYRTQIFLYLKACGREELTTMNLWGGVDG